MENEGFNGAELSESVLARDWNSPADLILCQITSRAHSDAYSIPLDRTDLERGQLGQPCFIRPQRLFTVEHHIILSSIGKVQAAKLDEVLKKARAFFD